MKKQVNPNVGKGLRGSKMKAHRASKCVGFKLNEKTGRFHDTKTGNMISNAVAYSCIG